MGSVCCCCLRVPDEEEEEAESLNGSNNGNCKCPICFIKNFMSKCRGLNSHGGRHTIPSSDPETNSSRTDESAPLTSSGSQELSSSSEVAPLIRSSERNKPRGQTLPSIAGSIDSRLQPDVVIVAQEKEVGGILVKEVPKESLVESPDKFLSFKDSPAEFSSEDGDVCPTCFEEYTHENPKIVAKCSHHYHLGCIYEWMERSSTCPACAKLMEFDETN